MSHETGETATGTTAVDEPRGRGVLAPVTDRLPTGRQVALGSTGLLGFVFAWWAASMLNPQYILPSPVVVVETFLAELRSGRMLTALRQSVTHWIPGTVVGTGLGVGLGVALAWNDRLDRMVAPVVRLLRPVPPLALIGFAIAWFGINHTGAAFIIAVGAFWINFYNAYGGVEGISADLTDVARSLGVDDSLTMIRKVVLPGAAPEILTGVRTGIGRCWMLVVAAEIFGVPGIGQRIHVASNNLAVDVVIAYILLLSLVYLVVDTAFRAVQLRVVAWQH
ncbi:ABC transporter permease [Halobacteriales archaeon Cl-PHB]